MVIDEQTVKSIIGIAEDAGKSVCNARWFMAGYLAGSGAITDDPAFEETCIDALVDCETNCLAIANTLTNHLEANNHE